MYKIYHKKFGKTLLNLARSVQSWLISALSVDIFILFINVNLFAFLMHDDFTATILSYYLFSFNNIFCTYILFKLFRCNLRNECDIFADTNNFGRDPCVAVPKYLEVTFGCYLGLYNNLVFITPLSFISML